MVIHAMLSGFPGYTAEPLPTQCTFALSTAEHACLGISPFNSYFSTERITHLVGWAASTFGSFHIFVPDVPAAYTLEALGYPPGRAKHKARRQANYLHNKITRALETARIAQPTTPILDWASLSGNAHYGSLLDKARGLFDSDEDFRAACLDASHWVLDKRLPADTRVTTAQLTLAARYFLSELPLFTDTAGIVGTKTSVFCYHQAIPFLRHLYKHELSWKPSPSQGFVVLSAADDIPAQHSRDSAMSSSESSS